MLFAARKIIQRGGKLCLPDRPHITLTPAGQPKTGFGLTPRQNRGHKPLASQVLQQGRSMLRHHHKIQIAHHLAATSKTAAHLGSGHSLL